jgi:hypothetical protein
MTKWCVTSRLLFRTVYGFLSKPRAVKRARVATQVIPTVIDLHFQIVGEVVDHWYPVKCKYCDENLRVRGRRAEAHLAQQPNQHIRPCSQVPENVQLEYAAKFKSCRSSSVSGTSNSIRAIFDAATRDSVDDAVARFFDANGLSFNVANSQVWMLDVHAE